MKNQTKTNRSTIAATGVITGGVAVALSLFMAFSANSLALWADCTATFLDFLAVLIAWKGFKKIETSSRDTFKYGYGKFESFFSMGMAVLMLISFFCIMIVATIRFQNPVQVEGFGVILGIALHLIFGFINGSLLFKTIKLEKQQKSPLLSAQRRVYFVKWSANIIMFGCLSLSYFLYNFEWTMYADPIAATVIAVMILTNATTIFRHSSRDLLDYALEEHSQLLILRSLAHHFDQYEYIQDIRTRVAGGKIYIEIFLEFDGDLKHSEVMETTTSLQTEITDLLNCDEVLIIPVKEKN